LIKLLSVCNKLSVKVCHLTLIYQHTRFTRHSRMQFLGLNQHCTGLSFMKLLSSPKAPYLDLTGLLLDPILKLG